MRRSIRVRLTVAFMSWAIGPLLLVGVILAWQSYTAQKRQALSLQREVTQRVSKSHLYNCLLTVLDAGTGPTAALRLARRPGTAQIHIPAQVLVVEDNVVNQRVARRLLEKLGCRVEVAANGQEAVTVLAQLAYDIVLMDCQMPKMDGFTATAVIRECEASTGKHIPIMTMTANALQGDRERCLAADMDDYISKPMQINELVAILRKWAPSTVTAG